MRLEFNIWLILIGKYFYVTIFNKGVRPFQTQDNFYPEKRQKPKSKLTYKMSVHLFFKNNLILGHLKQFYEFQITFRWQNTNTCCFEKALCLLFCTIMQMNTRCLQPTSQYP